MTCFTIIFSQYIDEDVEIEGEEGAEGRPRTKKVRPKRVKTTASVSKLVDFDC